MERNMLERKRRTAHIPKYDHKLIKTQIPESPPRYSENSSLKKEMFNNLYTAYPLKNKAYLSSSTKILFQPNSMMISSTSRNFKNTSKSKNTGFTRTSSLMEKTAKDFKQIKRNRNIPKPKAHLVALPEEVDAPYFGNGTAQTPAENLSGDSDINDSFGLKRDNRNNSDCDSSDAEYETFIEKESSDIDDSFGLKRNNRDNSDCDSSGAEYEKFIEKESSDIDDSFGLKSNNRDNSDCDSSDAEYETFIEKESRDLKNFKNTKNCTKKMISGRQPKNVAKNRISKTIFSSQFLRK